MRTGAVTLRIDSRLEHVALIGIAVRAICTAIPVTDEQAAAIELCVVEAVNNAVEHAYREEAGHPVEVRLLLGGGALRIAIRDRGRRMDWAAARAQADGYTGGLDEGGRGLVIMRSVMDHVSYRCAGGWNELSMRKRLDREYESRQLRDAP